MYKTNSNSFELPEWYSLERKTGETISRLSNIKELAYYLSHPEEGIRRLAILRANEIKLKDSVEHLLNILENPLEGVINKELAAWSIKSICHKYNIDLFISNRLLSKYTGLERTIDLLNVKTTVPDTPLIFDFTYTSALSSLDAENIGLQCDQSVMPYTAFPLRLWLNALLSVLMNNILVFPKKFVSLALRLIAAALLFTFVKVPRLFISRIRAVLKNRKTSSNYSYKSMYTPNHMIVRGLKSLVINFLFVLFFPVRTLVRHKLFSLAILICFYILLTFTGPGRQIAWKYGKINLVDTQHNAYYTLKEFGNHVWAEVQVLLAINNVKPGRPADAELINIKQKTKKYSVSSRNGVKLRSSPNGSSLSVMAYGSTVIFSGRTAIDSSGGEWMYVKTKNGKAGWVLSRWLKRQEDK